MHQVASCFTVVCYPIDEIGKLKGNTCEPRTVSTTWSPAFSLISTIVRKENANAFNDSCSIVLLNLNLETTAVEWY